MLDLGKALQAADNLKEAESTFREVVKTDANGALGEAAHYQLAQIYRKQGRTAEAETEIRKFQELRSRRR
jgi:Flp pilus assembly protein TadD